MTDLEAKARQLVRQCSFRYAYEREAVEQAILTALRSIRQEALEDAAKVAETWDLPLDQWSKQRAAHNVEIGQDIAARIRALKEGE